MKSKTTTGFTLIELMITVVIVAILAAVAYPSYTSYIAQSRRSDAQIALTQTAARMEKFFTQCGQYPTTNAELDGGSIVATGGSAACSGLGLPNRNSPDERYTLALVAPTAALGCTAGVPATQCFVLEATPVGPQLAADGGKCTTFTLSATGIKKATGTDSAKCWKK